MRDDAISQHLLAALRSSTNRHQIKPERIFNYWFRRDGTCLFFLFKKNLRITNIQFGELLSLLKTHIRVKGYARVPHLRFLSVPEFHWSFCRIKETFDLGSPKERSYVAYAYGQHFGQTVVIQPFFCSCAVYLPPLMSLDLLKVCGESGYIHSCGANLMTEFVYDTRTRHLFRAFDSFFKTKRDKKARVFTVYAREDWPLGSERQPRAVQDGIDQVKIPVNKFFMGNDPISTVLAKIKQRYGSKMLRVVQPGRLDEDRDKALKDPSVESQKTIFLIADQQITEHLKQPKDARFYICYEQQYINENPFHVFDEDKPAWVDQTTIPHTLAGAMINITRPWKPKRHQRICDPFCGSGTTWFEACKLPNTKVMCDDISPAAARVAVDNFRFFQASNEKLKSWQAELKTVGDLPRDKGSRARSQGGREFNAAAEAYSLWKDVADTDNYSAQKKLLRTKLGDESVRLIFYMMLKTSKRNHVNAGTDAWWDFYKVELKNHIAAIEVLWEQKDRNERPVVPQSPIAKGRGRYSASCYVDTRSMTAEPDFDGMSVLNLNKKYHREIDLIVTDPPYGFNTKEDQCRFAELYRRMIPTLLSTLSNDAQLVISVPEWSHTGRQLPASAYKTFLTHEILMAAAKENMEVIRTPYPVTHAASLFRAPFYWESERALRRAILHFRFKRW